MTISRSLSTRMSWMHCSSLHWLKWRKFFAIVCWKTTLKILSERKLSSCWMHRNKSTLRTVQLFLFIERTISFFALMIIFLITRFNLVDFASRNHSSTKFSIHFMTSSIIISTLRSATSELQSLISFVISSNNYEIIYVIVRIVRFIKSNDINLMTFYSQICRLRYSFTLSLLISFWISSNLAKNSMSLCQLSANSSSVSFAYWESSSKQSLNESRFCWIVSM